MSESTTPIFRSVPLPTEDPAALLATALALKENVDSLTRQRGTPSVWAATVTEVATGANGDGNFPTNAGFLRGLVDQAVTVVASVSQSMGLKVNRSGDAMTGPLTLPGNPIQAMHAATKAYVDLNGATDWNAIPNRPVAFPPKPHTHGILDVIGLQVELDNRALLAHSQPWTSLTPPEGTTVPVGWRLTWNGTQIVAQPPQQTNDGAGLSFGPAPPVNTLIYPFWFDTNVGSLYVWYDDGNSAQWVPAISDKALSVTSAAQAEIDTLKAENLDMHLRVAALEAAVAALGT